MVVPNGEARGSNYQFNRVEGEIRLEKVKTSLQKGKGLQLRDWGGRVARVRGM